MNRWQSFGVRVCGCYAIFMGVTVMIDLSVSCTNEGCCGSLWSVLFFVDDKSTETSLCRIFCKSIQGVFVLLIIYAVS